MAPFGQKKGGTEGVATVVPSPGFPSSLMGKTLLVQGEVFSEDDVMIDGRIEGKINVKNRVTIGNNALIRADIEARQVVIRGKVTGDVRASAQVEIVADGVLLGNITSPKVIIADGAVFEGNIDMKSRDEKAAAEDKPIEHRPAAGKHSDPGGPSDPNRIR